MPRLTATLLALLITTSGLPAFAQDESAEELKSDNYYELMKVLVDTFEQIDRNYVKEIDRRRIVEGAVRGMLTELDPYSNFIPPTELDSFTEDIEQEFGGIGVQVEFDAQLKGLEIVAPLPGSPAFAVGLAAGDKIVEVNGEMISSFTPGREQMEAIKRLKGPAGEQVEVGVVRSGVDGVQRYQVTRDKIQLPTVFGVEREESGAWDYTPDNAPDIAYLRISHFTRRTAEEVREAVKQVTEDGAKGLVIDLRFNPGGLLTAAVEIVNLFLESGMIVSTSGRNSQPREWKARKFGTYADIPIAVLINKYSASASEITSAALQDHDRAVVIGTRSWGKGSVQNVIDLEDGESALKLTTASYFRPSGKNIHRFSGATEDDEWGVLPSEGFEVDMTPKEMIQLQRQQRLRYSREEDTDGEEFVDKQLEKALEYLQTKINQAAPLKSAA